jgi:hypothetical protein
MDEASITQYITGTFANVETADNYGYTFFFCGGDTMHPFATLAVADYDYDRFSNLDRPGVYRLNIGVSKPTFQALFGAGKVDVSGYDFTVLDTIMPHPEYASQSFICVLSPGPETFEKLRPMLAEAYDIAVRRQAKRADRQAPKE